MGDVEINLYQVEEIELVYKQKVNPNQRPQIRSAQDAYDIFLKAWDENKIDFVEQSKVMFLNRANRVLGICTISTGGVSGTVVDPKIVFAASLKANASAIILAHNHPSGNTQPSDADKRITDRFIEGGKLLGIEVLDHVIVTREGFHSLANEMSYPSPF